MRILSVALATRYTPVMGIILTFDSMYRITMQRDGRKAVVLSNFNSLTEAQRELLRMANHDFETSYKNWGLMASYINRCTNGSASHTLSDGTRMYNYDVYTYSIIVE